MANRREFLSKTGILVAGGLFFREDLYGALSKHVSPHQIGLGLFTLFNVMDDDVPGSLKKVADIGYKEVESAFSKKGGYYGLNPKQFAALTKDLGLSWTSHHVLGAPFKLPKDFKIPTGADGKPVVMPSIRNLRDNYQELVDEAAEGGVKYLVCASTPIGSIDEIKSSVDVLNKSAEAAKKAGLVFCYHNHDAEFKKVDGQVPYDMILSGTDPSAVKMELDLAWVVKGGYDAVELFKKHPGRFPLWHVKDLSANHQIIEPVGNGSIDFKRIFAHAKTAGMEHVFVEHDMPADPFASIKTSFTSVTKLFS